MSKSLVILVLAVIVLSWNFIFTSDKKVDLTDSAKVLQGLSMAIPYKLAVLDYWKTHKVLPDADAWQKQGKQPKVDISKSLVSHIDVGVDGPGAISVFFTNKDNISVAKDINGEKIVLNPAAGGERLSWSCTGTIDKEYLPNKCH